MEDSSKPTYVPADFNLQNWATIAVAAALWNKPNVTFFFHSKYGYATDDYIHQMVKKNQKEFHSLPRKIANRILCTFKFMGQRIALWCDYAVYVLKIPKNVAATLHWTVYGTIDEGKILRNCLDAKIIGHSSNSKEMQAVYYAACSNVYIDYVRLHWEKMLGFCNFFKLNSGSSPEIANKFILCSVIFLAKLESSQLPETRTRYYNDFKYKQKRKMFMLSVEEGCPQAVRYYWSLLSAAEKKDLIISAAMLSLDCYRKSKLYDYFVTQRSLHIMYGSYASVISERHKNKCFADLVIFFITQMSEDEISEFFNHLNQYFETDEKENITAVFDVLIYHWPLEEFVPLACDVALKICEKPTDSTKPVLKLLEAMHRNKKFGLCNKHKFYQKLFKALWSKLIKYNTCEEILGSDGLLLQSICNLFDFEVLKFIIDNCEDEYRKTIITHGKTAFEKLVEDEEFELLQKFMDDVLRFEDEREWFRDTCLKSSNLLIGKMRFNELKTLLDVINCTNEEQEKILNKEHVIFQCARLFFENQIELADLGLNLIFNSEVEKQNYLKNFLAENISWVVSVGESKKTDFADCIPKFLRWLLKSEVEAIQIHHEKLISQNSLKNLFALLFGRSRKGPEIFKMVDEFLLFCLRPEKITALKRNIRKKLQDWIEFLSDECCLHNVDDFLNWIVESEDFKKCVIKRFLRSNSQDF